MTKAEAQETAFKFNDLKDFIKKDLKFSSPPATFGDGELADQIFWLRELKKMAEAREKLLNGVLQSRHQVGLAALKTAYDNKGEKEYLKIAGQVTEGVVYEYVVQQRLNTELIATEMGADWIEEHKSPTTFFQAKVIKG